MKVIKLNGCQCAHQIAVIWFSFCIMMTCDFVLPTRRPTHIFLDEEQKGTITNHVCTLDNEKGASIIQIRG